MTEQQRRHDAEENQTEDANQGRGDAAAVDDVTQLREQLEQERVRADTNYSNWQRATADFLNYKRRAEQEREESARYANTALVLNVLPAVDDLERALQHVDPALEDSVWIEGVRQILRKLKGALNAAGSQKSRLRALRSTQQCMKQLQRAKAKRARLCPKPSAGTGLEIASSVLRWSWSAAVTAVTPNESGERSRAGRP